MSRRFFEGFLSSSGKAGAGGGVSDLPKPVRVTYPTVADHFLVPASES